MARRDPLLPNAGIVARREYRERTRSPLFIVSTIVLMGIALLVTLAPIGIRYFDSQTVLRIAIVAEDDELALGAIGVTDSLLNIKPDGVDEATWKRPFVIARADDAESATADLGRGKVAGVMTVTRLPSGQIDVVYTTNTLGDTARNQMVGFAAVAVGIVDWTSALPEGSDIGAFQPPAFRLEGTNLATEGGVTISPQAAASRSFLGIVFVVLLFMTVIIYGMWVATGVAAEKSSRVMELMISAASPRQLLAGKVIGIGGAGLTQYIAILVPALLVLSFQDRIAEAVLGPAGAAGTPLVGLTPGLLLGYGVFFMLGFTLFALIYASMGSFVSRPDDLQTLSLPLSFVAVAGYLSAILALGGGGGAWTMIASFLPPFSPFVMLARLMVGAVPPWQVSLSIGILVVTIVVVAIIATRMYAAGVLLYGQRPGVRAFIAAARRAG